LSLKLILVSLVSLTVLLQWIVL